MLTIRQNLLETIKGGNPDRFVKQYEFMQIIYEALFPMHGIAMQPGTRSKDGWGVSWEFPEGQTGPFPNHDDDHKVVTDITKWKEVVKSPPIPEDDESWAPALAHAKSVDRNEFFVTVWFAPGLFERVHHLMGMEDALLAFYEEPEEMQAFIDYVTQYELEFARVVTEKIQPDALFHHDDWGSNINSFLSPDMFNEFIVPSYKKIYDFYKANGVEIIVHHSDSYAANLVPHMIDMGIDIWQGPVPNNDIAALMKTYGDKISFMGGIDSAVIDLPDWKPETITKEVERACKEYGRGAYIPCHTMGGPDSSHPGVYAQVNKEIDRLTKEMF